MLKYVLLSFIFCFFLIFGGVAQVSCSKGDSLVYYKLLQKVNTLPSSLRNNNRFVEIGKLFLNTKYVGKTLEINKKEQLVINFQGLDCTTFLENTLAFYLVAQSKDTSFQNYLTTLTAIRYREGKLDDYTSRLHYLTEWLKTKEKQGILSEETENIAKNSTMQRTAPINFMSAHPDSYPALKGNTENRNKIKGIENSINANYLPLDFIPKKNIEIIVSKIKNGDIIGFTTAIKGLDFVHVGIAIEIDKQIKLLHASSDGKVKISEKTLVEYINKNKSQAGIVIFRLK